MTNLTNLVNTQRTAALALFTLNTTRVLLNAIVEAAYAAFNAAGRPASYTSYLTQVSHDACEATLSWCRAPKVVAA